MKKLREFLKKHKKLRVVLIIILVLIIVSIISSIVNNGKKDINTNTMNTEIVERKTISNYVAMTGTIIANDSQTVYSTQNNLKVLEVNVEVGDTVKEGDVIAVLDATDFEEQLETAKRQLAVDEAKRDLGLRIAAENLQDARVDGLDNWKEGEISVAQANTDYYYAQIDVQRACEDLSRAQGDLNYAISELEQQIEDAKDAKKKYKKQKEDSSKSSDERKEAESKYEAAKDKLEELEDKYNNREHTLSSYYNAVNSAQRNVENANQQLEKTQRSVANANEKFADSAEDARRKIVDQTESLQERQLDASVATDSAEDKVKNLEKIIDECTIKAPMSGVITSVSMEEGDETANDNNTICVIQDTSGFKAEGTVDEYDISKIYEGMKAIIKTEATGDLEMTGTVSFVSPTPKSSSSQQSDSSSSAAIYPVRVLIDSLDDAVRIGMTAETKLIIDTAEDVLTVPYDCIEDKEDGTSVIYIANSGNADGQSAEDVGGKPGKDTSGKTGKDTSGKTGKGTGGKLGKEIVVTKGLETDYYTEISGDGVKEGMEVYVVGDNDTSDGEGFGGMGPGFGGPGRG